MKSLNKSLKLILAALMVLTLLPVSLHAESTGGVDEATETGGYKESDPQTDPFVGDGTVVGGEPDPSQAEGAGEIKEATETGGSTTVDCEDEPAACDVTLSDNIDWCNTDDYPYSLKDGDSYIGYDTFAEAYEAADANGAIIRLAKESKCPYDWRELSDAVSPKYNVFIRKNITLVGNGNKIYLSKNGIAVGGEDEDIQFVLQDVELINEDAAGRLVSSRGNVSELILKNVTGKADGGAGQAITIGGYDEDTTKLRVYESYLSAENGYGITVFNPADIEVEDSKLNAWGIFNLKEPSSSVGSANSDVRVYNSELTSVNNYSGESNNYGLIIFSDKNVVDSYPRVTLTKTLFDIKSEGDAKQALVVYKDYETPGYVYIDSNKENSGYSKIASVNEYALNYSKSSLQNVELNAPILDQDEISYPACERPDNYIEGNNNVLAYSRYNSYDIDKDNYIDKTAAGNVCDLTVAIVSPSGAQFIEPGETKDITWLHEYNNSDYHQLLVDEYGTYPDYVDLTNLLVDLDRNAVTSGSVDKIYLKSNIRQFPEDLKNIIRAKVEEYNRENINNKYFDSENLLFLTADFVAEDKEGLENIIHRDDDSTNIELYIDLQRTLDSFPYDYYYLLEGPMINPDRLLALQLNEENKAEINKISAATLSLDGYGKKHGIYVKTDYLNRYGIAFASEGNYYDVKFVDYDGTVLQEEVLKENTIPTYSGKQLSREGYIYKGWDAELTAVKADTTYTAVYEEIPSEYTIKFVNDDGSLLKTYTLKEGEFPMYDGSIPVKKSDNYQYRFVFDNWTPALTLVDGNKTYTALYKMVYNSLQLEYRDYDGVVLLSTSVKYPLSENYVAEHAPTKVTRDASKKYVYTFTGWHKQGSSTTKEIYVAQYKEELRKYKVTFVDDDGTVLKEATEYEYGTDANKIVRPKDPTKAASNGYTYTFAGWNYEVADVTGDAVYRATYNKKGTSVEPAPKMGDC